MAISDELTKLQTNLTNSYSACEEKGATLPAQQNFDNLANTINSIESGGVGVPKVVVDGVFSNNGVSEWKLPDDVIKIGANSCRYSQYKNDNLTTLDLNNVEEIEDYGLDYGCYGASALTSVKTGKLKKIGAYGLRYGFYDASALETPPDLTNLEEVLNYGLQYAFVLTAIKVPSEMPKLRTVGTYGCANMYYLNKNLTKLPDLSGITSVGNYGMKDMFYDCENMTGDLVINAKGGTQSFYGICYDTNITYAVFNEVETVTSNAFRDAFGSCHNLHREKIAHMFPKLKNINGNATFHQTFRYGRIYKLIFDALEGICVTGTGYNCFYLMFEYGYFRTKKNGQYVTDGGIFFPVLKQIGTSSTSTYSCLASICPSANSTGILDFPELTTVYNNSSNTTRGCFTTCGAIGIYMPKVTDLGTYNKNNFYNSTSIKEIHFGIENQATIEAMNGYSSKFGASNATIYFDLVNHITVGGVVYDRYGRNYDYDNGYYSWNNGDTVIYTTNEYTPAVGDSVYTKTDGVYTETGTIEGVA